MVAQVYRARKPRASPLWQCLTRHFDRFQAVYEERYQSRHGFLRPIIPEVVHKFMDCGDLEHGFARIRCDHCQKDHLLAFSCKGRWFCPSCHQKKVLLFGALMTESILFPVPHRHVTLTIPKMLRPSCRSLRSLPTLRVGLSPSGRLRYHRDLLKDLCRIAHECVRDVMRVSLDQPDGMPGIVMAIHTFGEYLDFHPHLHLLMADGLFLRDERFLVLPENGMDAVEELFRAKLITFLSKQGLLQPERARMLRSWKHSGFNVHRSRRIQPDEREDLERVARYIIRNPFSLDKMEFKPPNAVNKDGTVIYRSGMNPKIHRNFQIFTPCELPFALLTPAHSCRPSPFGRLIAAITQHIPDKSFQLVRYYGWYSNKMRGQRKKHAEEEKAAEEVEEGVEIIDVSDHQPRRIPSKKWRDLIKKVWEADPLICPTCQREMRIVSFIDERDVIEKMLKCLGLWEQGVRVEPNCHSGTDPPTCPAVASEARRLNGDWVYEPVDHDPFPACHGEVERRRDYDTEPVLFYANA